MNGASPVPRPDLLDRVGRRLPTRWAAPALLVIMSITFAELLTGSTPFLVLVLNPLSIVFLVGLYGGGVLAVRECAVRARLRWPAVLLLGAAYGILEEGFATRTFFDPSAVGYLGLYGHWGGVNWVWAAQLMIFHAVFSITLPIFLLDVAAPSTRGRPLLSDRGAWLALAATLLTAFVMFFLFDHGYRPTIVGLVFFGLLAIGLVGLALRSPVRRWAPAPAPGPARPGRLVALGVVGVSTFFALNWVGPFLVPIPAVLIGLMVMVGLGLAFLAWREWGRLPIGPATVALSIGLLSFLLLLASAMELVGDWGVGLVVIGVVGFLYLLYRRFSVKAGVALPGPPVGVVRAI